MPARAPRTWLIAGLLAIQPVAVAACSNAELPGFTVPSRDLDVAAENVGIVAKVAVAPGDQVSAGTLLAALDSRVLLAERAIAQERAAAGGELAAAEARLALATQRLSQLERVQRRGAARPDEVAEARAERAMAAAELQRAQEMRAVAARALELLDARLEQRTIRSPIDGVVVELHRDEGELVGRGESRIATVHTVNPLQVEVYVPATCRPQLAADLSVNVVFTSDGVSREGHWLRLGTRIDEASGLVLGVISLPNPDGNLLVGERVSVVVGGPS